MRRVRAAQGSAEAAIVWSRVQGIPGQPQRRPLAAGTGAAAVSLAFDSGIVRSSCWSSSRGGSAPCLNDLSMCTLAGGVAAAETAPRECQRMMGTSMFNAAYRDLAATCTSPALPPLAECFTIVGDGKRLPAHGRGPRAWCPLRRPRPIGVASHRARSSPRAEPRLAKRSRYGVGMASGHREQLAIGLPAHAASSAPDSSRVPLCANATFSTHAVLSFQ